MNVAKAVYSENHLKLILSLISFYFTRTKNTLMNEKLYNGN